MLIRITPKMFIFLYNLFLSFYCWYDSFLVVLQLIISVYVAVYESYVTTPLQVYDIFYGINNTTSKSCNIAETLLNLLILLCRHMPALYFTYVPLSEYIVMFLLLQNRLSYTWWLIVAKYNLFYNSDEDNKNTGICAILNWRWKLFCQHTLTDFAFITLVIKVYNFYVNQIKVKWMGTAD